MDFDLLTEIIGTKAKVAVLRTLTFSSGLPARQVQTRSNKSWGAVKKTIDALLKTGIILVKKGQWSDEVFLNPNHCLYGAITSLFQAEKGFLKEIASVIFNYSTEYNLDLLSCYLLPDSNTIYLICKYPKIKGTSHKIRELVTTHGLPGEFSVEITDSTKFSSIWHHQHHPNNFVLLHGEVFPYLGVERALDFFDIKESTVYSKTPTDGGNR